MAADTERNQPPAAANVCIADPDDAFRRRLGSLLGELGAELRGFASGAALLAGIDAGTACVISDLRLADMTGIELIGALRTRHPGLPVIVLAQEGDVATAVSVMRAGALDFIEKAHADRLLAWHVRRLLENRGSDGVAAPD